MQGAAGHAAAKLPSRARLSCHRLHEPPQLGLFDTSVQTPFQPAVLVIPTSGCVMVHQRCAHASLLCALRQPQQPSMPPVHRTKQGVAEHTDSQPDMAWHALNQQLSSCAHHLFEAATLA